MAEKLEFSFCKPENLEFSFSNFDLRLEAVIEQAKRIFNAQLQITEKRTFEESFSLTNSLSNLLVSCVYNLLENFGLKPVDLSRLKSWKNVVLRFREDKYSCSLVHVTKREMESSKLQTTWSDGDSTTHKLVTTVNVHLWSLVYEYELLVFDGVDPTTCLSLQKCQRTIDLKTDVPEPPFSEIALATHDVDLSPLFRDWLSLAKTDEPRACFSIDRNDKKTCRTPSNNKQVRSASSFMADLTQWSFAVKNRLLRCMERTGGYFSPDCGSSIFVPLVPIDFDKKPLPESSQLPLMVRVDDHPVWNVLSEEHKKSLSSVLADTWKLFQQGDLWLQFDEGRIVAICNHIECLADHYNNCVAHATNMLRDQLIAAVGKTLTNNDFAEYMKFHRRNVYKEPYRPKEFAYAIRRPDHDPCGFISLEDGEGSAVETFSTHFEAPMSFALDASSKVQFHGECMVHSMLRHEFNGKQVQSLNLHLRAKQFSSFLVLMGRISGPSSFDPQCGVLVQNKDDLTIPLNLVAIPSKKAFEKAVKSLSPTQQEFANMFRAMQMSHTLFGVCVIQVKPNVEQVLKLSPYSLDKEIRLTQDVMNVFLKGNIPPDLIAAKEKDPNAIESVRTSVGAMTKLLGDMQKAVLSNGFTISVQTLTGKKISLNSIKKTFTIKQIKRRIQEVEGIPPDQQRLIYAGLQLEDNMILEKLGVTSDCTFHLVLRLRGGGPEMIIVADDSEDEEKDEEGSDNDDNDDDDDDESCSGSAETPQSDASQSNSTDVVVDASFVTDLPKKLENAVDESVSPCIINVSERWTLASYESIISNVRKETCLYSNQFRLLFQNCKDLLDALSKSGSLSLCHCTMHVITVLNHSFPETLMNTLVEENVNPIEILQRSDEQIASVIFRKPVEELLKKTLSEE